MAERTRSSWREKQEREQEPQRRDPVPLAEYFAAERGNTPVLRREILSLVETCERIIRRRRWYWRLWMRIHMTIANFFRPRVVVIEVEKRSSETPEQAAEGPSGLITPP